jgi:catechol 2,3-dioxygenase-like lactoylglutathione lyase family enzyme
MRYAIILVSSTARWRTDMLGNASIVAFAPTRNSSEAKRFYAEVLGLTLEEETPFALVFDADGVMLRVTIVENLSPAFHTIVGWHVPDIAAVVTGLDERGVRFKRYPHVEQDALGVWTSPDGARIAWFEDPDGNILSLTQAPVPKSES